MSIQLRRRAIVAAQLLLVLWAAGTAVAQTNYSEGGYADATSYAPGATAEFRIATAISPFDLQIVNLVRPSVVLTTVRGLTSTTRDCTGMWENGCGWPVTTTFTIPSEWPSGYYAARFPTSAGTRNIIFVVRAASPGTASRIVVVSPTNTYIAYNQYSGKCVYDTLSTNGQRAYIVSYRRPYSDNNGLGRYPLWEQQFAEWMTAENRPFDVISDDDVENASLLSSYTTVVLLGHPEYWTGTARQNLEKFSASGGHIAVLGGNTMWWQARVDLPARQFICYKDATLDPITTTNPELATINWYRSPVLNPENLALGASFRNGGYANTVAPGDTRPLPDEQRTPFTVTSPQSWIFAGTGVTKGQSIGQAAGGIEVDGAIFNTDAAGNATVDGSDGTPVNFDILATIPADTGYGTIGFFTTGGGGGVFNAGTRDWSHGLRSDAVIQQMTRNVLDRFATGAPFAYTPPAAQYLTLDLFNTPSPTAGVLPGWRGTLQASSLSASCAHEGPLGLQLAGTTWLQYKRNFTPASTGINAAAVQFYINAALLTASSANNPTVDLRNRINPNEPVYAAVEIQNQTAGKALRLALRRTDESRSVATQWVLLPSGWQPVRVSWRSPGTVELQVGSSAPVQAYNPEAGQLVTDVTINFPGSAGLGGSLCIDELSVRTTFGPASPATSTLTADPVSIVADGTATSAIAVTLNDDAGRRLLFGGDRVSVSTTAGTLSAVTDNRNGTYSATLTASRTAGPATIAATVNGAPMTQTALVTFTAGPASALSISAPSSVTTGAPFDVTVAVRDANGNIVTQYSGSVHFASDDGAATLPPDYTFTTADNGQHLFTGIVLRAVGPHSVTVSSTSDGVSSTSASIAVQAPTTTTLTSSRNPAPYGAAVTLRATVTASATGPTMTGSVRFDDGATILGTASLSNGAASFVVSTLAPGSHSLTASYLADSTYKSSTSAPVTQYITLPAPVIDAATETTSRVKIVWPAIAGAANYVVERSANGSAYAVIATVTTSTVNDSVVAPSTAYLYRVRAVDAAGNAGATSTPAVATTIVFSAPVAGGPLRAQDLMDARVAVDVLRRSAGLPPASYTRAAVTAGMVASASDVTEIRTAVNAARVAAAMSAWSFTDEITPGVTPIKAQHLRELQVAAGARPPS